MTALRTSLIRCLPILAFVLVAALVLAAPAEATKKLAKELDLVCTTCHDKPGSKLLTDEGKFFETMRTLEGYDELMDEFGSCTTCHTQKPGSMKLTKVGKEHQKQLDVDDMEELCNWIEKENGKEAETKNEEREEPAESADTR